MMPTENVICMVRIPGEPVPKGRPRFTLRGGTYTPQRTQEQEHKVQQYLMMAYPQIRPYEGPVGVWMRFHCKGRGRSDLDNLQKLVWDAMNGLVYVDDRQIEEADIKRLRNATEPATVVVVYRV